MRIHGAFLPTHAKYSMDGVSCLTLMNRWKKAEKLSNLIVKFGKGEISKDTADLVAYRYFSKKTFWDMIKPNHTSLSQIANCYVIAGRK